ncbi:unnamed protein product, partial [Amoebophrya sp. A25]
PVAPPSTPSYETAVTVAPTVPPSTSEKNDMSDLEKNAVRGSGKAAGHAIAEGNREWPWIAELIEEDPIQVLVTIPTHFFDSKDSVLVQLLKAVVTAPGMDSDR